MIVTSRSTKHVNYAPLYPHDSMNPFGEGRGSGLWVGETGYGSWLWQNPVSPAHCEKAVGIDIHE
jgi:hypothetical protein